MFRRGWLLILCLLASSLVATASVCANETSGAATISCGGLADTHEDADQSQSDAEKGAPHNHAVCHGHGVTVVLPVAALAPVAVSPSAPSPSQPVRLARRTIDPALKPPKA